MRPARFGMARTLKTSPTPTLGRDAGLEPLETVRLFLLGSLQRENGKNAAIILDGVNRAAATDRG